MNSKAKHRTGKTTGIPSTLVHALCTSNLIASCKILYKIQQDPLYDLNKTLLNKTLQDLCKIPQDILDNILVISFRGS